MRTIDLNADLGEIPSHLPVSPLLTVVSSANVACGVHAGDPLTMHRTLTGAMRHGVVAGAHPSYPDRENFGRKGMFLGSDPKMTDAELHAVIDAQLSAFASMTGGVIPYVKPHGALYNDAQVSEKVARIVAHQADRHNAAVFGQPGSMMQRVCDEYGLRFFAEVFADRGYDHYGRLIPRTMPHAEYTRPAGVAQRAVQMVTERTVRTWGFDHETGKPAWSVYEFPRVDTVCLHGDTRGAYEIAKAVKAALVAAGVTIASPLGGVQ